MRRLPRCGILFLAGSLFGCAFGPVDHVGKRCPCVEGLVCSVDDTCQPLRALDIECEDLDYAVAPHLEIVDDPTASAGRYATVTPEALPVSWEYEGSFRGYENSGVASLRDLPAGTYAAHVRLAAPHGEADAVYMVPTAADPVAGQRIVRNATTGPEPFLWIGTYGRGGAPIHLTFSATDDLRLIFAEPEVRCDRILLTNERDFDPDSLGLREASGG